MLRSVFRHCTSNKRLDPSFKWILSSLDFKGNSSDTMSQVNTNIQFTSSGVYLAGWYYIVYCAKPLRLIMYYLIYLHAITFMLSKSTTQSRLQHVNDLCSVIVLQSCSASRQEKPDRLITKISLWKCIISD
ncbi:hypothetical protein Mapa_002358 [Marchantia paleacea]|nr:hypothetical protein Mapa_002358 [Marchantia paleacea]